MRNHRIQLTDNADDAKNVLVSLVSDQNNLLNQNIFFLQELSGIDIRLHAKTVKDLKVDFSQLQEPLKSFKNEDYLPEMDCTAGSRSKKLKSLGELASMELSNQFFLVWDMMK
jgi:hypothetical protein